MLLAALFATLGEKYSASARRATFIVTCAVINWFVPGSLLRTVEAVFRAVHSTVDTAVFRYNIKLGSSIVFLVQT